VYQNKQTLSSTTSAKRGSQKKKRNKIKLITKPFKIFIFEGDQLILTTNAKLVVNASIIVVFMLKRIGRASQKRPNSYDNN